MAPHSIIAESNGESIFDDDVFSMLQNKKVLDVGSDYYEYAIQYSSVAKKLLGSLCRFNSLD